MGVCGLASVSRLTNMHWLLCLTASVFLLASSQGRSSLLSNTRARCPRPVLQNGQARLRSNNRVVKYQCLRGYQLIGNKFSTCVQHQWSFPTPVCIMDRCKAFNVPHGQVLETYKGAFATVHCDPGYSLIGNQGVYCNGATWNDTIPRCQENEAGVKKECDFESDDLCGWTYDTNQVFDWKRHSYATPSGNVSSGPAFDHTLGQGLNGHYMHIESSSSRVENDSARLYSPVFKVPVNESACFVFWYHMFGNTTGSLNVYLLEKDSVLLFDKQGDLGDEWQNKILPLPRISSKFQIMIEGVRGAGSGGDIAIDDVKLAFGIECPAPTVTSDEVITASSCDTYCLDSTSDSSTCSAADCSNNSTEQDGLFTQDALNVSPIEDITIPLTTTINTIIMNSRARKPSATFVHANNKSAVSPASVPITPVISTQLVVRALGLRGSRVTAPTPLTNVTSPENVTNSKMPISTIFTTSQSYHSTIPISITKTEYNSTENLTTNLHTVSETTPTKIADTVFKTTPIMVYTVSKPPLTTVAHTLSKTTPITKTHSVYKTTPTTNTHIVSESTLTTIAHTVSRTTPTTIIYTVSKPPLTTFSHTPSKTTPMTNTHTAYKTTPTTNAHTVSETTTTTIAHSVSKLTPPTVVHTLSEKTPTTIAHTVSKATPITTTHIVSKLTPIAVVNSVSKTPPTTISHTLSKSWPSWSNLTQIAIMPILSTRYFNETKFQSITKQIPTMQNNMFRKRTTLNPTTVKYKTLSPRNDFIAQTSQTSKNTLTTQRRISIIQKVAIASSSEQAITSKTPLRMPKSTISFDLSVTSSSAANSSYPSTPYFKDYKTRSKNDRKSINDVLFHGIRTKFPPSTASRDTSPLVSHTSMSPVTTLLNEDTTNKTFDYENGQQSQGRSALQFNTTQPAANIAPYTSTRSSASNKVNPILVWVCLVLLLLCSIFTIIVIVRKRRINRKTNEDDELDIKFLAPDEILDFTLSRPEEFDERAF